MATTLSPERIARLGLVPLLSARALIDPHCAMRRTARLASAACGAAAVTCVVPALSARVRWGQGGGASSCAVPLRHDAMEFGQLTIDGATRDLPEVAALAAALAAPLGLLLAVHATRARALQSLPLAPQRLHDLNNRVNAVSLQIGVLHAVLQRTRANDPSLLVQCVDRSVGGVDRLVRFVRQLREG